MQPVTVTDLDIAFGRISALMPDRETLDEQWGKRDRSWGSKLFSCLFYTGGQFNLTPKPGIDRSVALRHIRAIMGSFEPKHEHKEAACAYLFELWFEQPATDGA